MGLETSVGKVQRFAERTFHSLTALAGSYAARLKSGYKEHGSRIALGGLFFPSVISPVLTATTPFNGVPQSLSSRDAIVLPLKSTISTDSKITVNGNLITGLTAKINNGQEIPPPAPGEINQPFDLPPNTTRLISPLLVSADGTQLQPKVNEQEAPVTEDAGVEPPTPPTEPEPEKDNNQAVPPPPKGVSANPPSELDLGIDESRVLSLATDAEGNPIPNAPAGGESTEIQLNLPYLRRFTNADGSIVFNNTGDQVGLKEGDKALLEATLTPLAKKYKPNGVEFFFPNGSLEPDFNKPGYIRLRDRLKNFSYEDVFLGGFTNSFLGNTGIVIGERPDGVTEIHLAFILKPGASPTDNDIREHGFMLTDTLGRQMAGGYSEKTKDDLSELRSKLIDRRSDEPNKPFPLMPAIAPS